MPDWYRDHNLSPECYSEAEYLDWCQDKGLYVDAAGNVDYGPPAGEGVYSNTASGSMRSRVLEYERHCREAHGGESCDCPSDTESVF